MSVPERSAVPLSRRGVLLRGVALGLTGAALGATASGRGAAAGSGAATPPGPAAAGSASSGDAYDALRGEWFRTVTGGAFDAGDQRFAHAVAELDRAATAAAERLDRRPDRDRVFTDLPFDGSSRITSTYTRLRTLATAWATPGSAFRGEPAALADVLDGLATTEREVYHAGRPEFGNWWDWEIGSSRALMDTCVLVCDHLPADALDRYLAAVDHFVPDPRYMFLDARRQLSTGANRVDLCQAVVVRGILGRNEAKVAAARDALSEIFTYVTEGDGFYRDGSFVQHTRVAYTGTYGIELIGGMARQLALLAGSEWEVTDPDREVLFDAVERAYRPVVYDSQMMDSVRGRAVTRANRTEHDDGHSAVEHILRLARGVDPARAARWRAICRGWLERDSYDDILADASVPRVALVTELLGDLDVRPEPEPVGHHLFANMDRAVHRRPGWAYGIAMASTRIAYYEAGNGENEKGFHTGDGMTYLYNSDNGQFTDGFWPTVDLYRLPGITVDTRRLPDSAGGEWGEARPRHATWVGGAVLADPAAMAEPPGADGLAGAVAAVGMELEALMSPLRARKSWFCLDEYVVALGAGVTGGGGHRVETVVENRNLHASGVERLLVDGERQAVDPDWSAVWDGVRWAHLEGVGGYVFPGGARLHGLREARTGRWSDVNDSGPTAPLTRRYQTMWFDHGVDPVDDRYAYLLLPGADPDRTARLARDPEVQLLANTSAVQAVRVPRYGLLAANFWEPGRAGDVTVDAPCAVVLAERDGRLSVAVADPTHLNGRVGVTLDRAGYRSWSADPTVTVHSAGSPVRFDVDVRGAHGATHQVRFTRA